MRKIILTCGLLTTCAADLGAAVVWDQLPRPDRQTRLIALATAAVLCIAAFILYRPFTYGLLLTTHPARDHTHLPIPEFRPQRVE